MNFLSSRRFFVVYSGVLTVVFCMTVLIGFSASMTKSRSFDEIDVRRINVRESGGDLEHGSISGSNCERQRVPASKRYGRGTFL